MTVTPGLLHIGTFYDGTSLHVEGTVPAESQVVLRFVGASCELHMRERGKVLGVMWMNLDSLIFRGVPSVCLVSSALAFDKLAGSGGPEQQEDFKSLELSGIQAEAQVESNGLDRRVAFEEFLKLKRGEGLYREMVGNVAYGPASNGRKTFEADIPIPSRLTPGAYQVELAAISQGKIIARTQQPVTVDLVGFPALLSRLAFDHAALYGVLATVIAILAGLAIGMVFQSKGAH